MSDIDRGNYICTGSHGQLGIYISLYLTIHTNWTSYESNVSMNKNLDVNLNVSDQIQLKK